MPCEFLKLDATDFQFNLLVASVGLESEMKSQQKAAKINGRQRGIVTTTN